jgi:hypothetical protein
MLPARIVLGIVVAATAVLALAGCVQPPPRVIPTSEPSAAPVFASDAAALAAAKKAYVAYLAVSDEVATDGGRNPERFGAVVTKSWLPREVSSAKTLVASKRRQEGSTSVQNITLQQSSQQGHVASVSIYVCLDLSAVHFVDSDSGENPSTPVTSLVPVEVDLASTSNSASTLLVERNTPWQGANFCQ